MKYLVHTSDVFNINSQCCELQDSWSHLDELLFMSHWRHSQFNRVHYRQALFWNSRFSTLHWYRWEISSHWRHRLSLIICDNWRLLIIFDKRKLLEAEELEDKSYFEYPLDSPYIVAWGLYLVYMFKGCRHSLLAWNKWDKNMLQFLYPVLSGIWFLSHAIYSTVIEVRAWMSTYIPPVFFDILTYSERVPWWHDSTWPNRLAAIRRKRRPNVIQYIMSMIDWLVQTRI